MLHVTSGTYEELMLGVKGKGKGKRGRVSKKGGSKIDIDEVMELGYGERLQCITVGSLDV